MAVTGSAAGLHFSRTRVRAGTVRFTISTTNPVGSSVTLFRLRRGVTLTRLAADFTNEFSENAAVRARATRNLDRDAEFYGLAEVRPDSPATVTVRLRKGTYYAAELVPGFKPDSSSVTTFRVVGHQHHGHHGKGHRGDGSRLPRAGATITMVNDRFVVSGRLRAKSAVRVRNHDDTIHIAIIAPVKAGTTDAQVQAYFDSGSQEAPTFEREGPGVTVNLLSQGREVVLGHNLPRGTYVLLCYVADEDDGMFHVEMGMHKVVTLT
ncbi:MAG TPA: hypothetical protein VF635_16095 [Propionibacteriaceae bacterium]